MNDFIGLFERKDSKEYRFRPILPCYILLVGWAVSQLRRLLIIVSGSFGFKTFLHLGLFYWFNRQSIQNKIRYLDHRLQKRNRFRKDKSTNQLLHKASSFRFVLEIVSGIPLTLWEDFPVHLGLSSTLWPTMWKAKAKICSTLAFELFLKSWLFL